MDQPIVFRVIGKPAPKGSPRVVTKGKGGKPLPFPRVLKDSKATVSWHQAVAGTAEIAMRARAPFAGKALSVAVVFRLRRPKGHYGKKGLRPSAPAYPAVKPDLDKLVRATMDPLEGVVFDGDSRIVLLNAEKHYADLGEAESATITVALRREPQP